MTKKLKRPVAFLSAFVMAMAMLLYFPSGIFSIDFGLKASAAATITLSAPTEGDGSSDNPYQISTKEELYWFAACVNGTDGVTQNTSANAVLTTDITVNEGVLKPDGTLNSTDFTSWTPISTSDSKVYTGTFDGKNHKISGLYFNDTSKKFVGLFGYVTIGGTVSNVGVVDSYFSGSNYVGGVCGANYGTIECCYNTGAVNGTGWDVGGVCGLNSAYSGTATITNCYNTGEVSGSEDVGGVCGYNNSGTITNCYNTGTVSGTIQLVGSVGGVCAHNSSGTIKNCYNTGAVTAAGEEAFVGGVCAVNFVDAFAGTVKIINCYNTGAVNGSGQIGGVCGYNSAYSGTATITNCYNTGEVSGSENVGGVCGWNHSNPGNAEITNCYFNKDNYSGSPIGVNEYGVVTKVAGKTTDDFNSGEVAYLLSQGENGSVWGQEIGTDSMPVMGGKKVLTNVDESQFANDVIIYGQNAALDGTIGFNIYVSADDSYDWDKTIGGVTGVKNEDGLYVFTYNVSAKNMDESINFTVNDKIDVTVSVSDYLVALSETDNESLKNLADSMSAYGDAAKEFFSSGTVAEQTVTDDLSVYNFTVGTMPEGISYYGSSLLLESETTIRHYFKIAEGQIIANFAFTVDGESVEPVAKQGYYYIDIKNVSAKNLGTSFSVSVNDEEVIRNYSVLSYVYKVLNSDSTDDDLKNLVKALYLYSNAAIAYMN